MTGPRPQEEPEPLLTPLSPPFPWAAASGLFAACVVGTFAMIPFTYSLILQMQFPGLPLSSLPMLIALGILADAVLGLLLSVAAIGVGLWLAERIGAGTPLFHGWGVEWAGRGRALKGIALGAIIGVGLGALIVVSTGALAGSVPGAHNRVQLPDAWEGLLASIGAGIREEVWLRLGLMTFLSWVGTSVSRRRTPTAPVVWAANLLAALVFASIHLPQAAQLIGLNRQIVTFVFLGNGLPGLVFGWLFWRKGLVAAAVSHFFLDVVLKVVLPLLGG